MPFYTREIFERQIYDARSYLRRFECFRPYSFRISREKAIESQNAGTVNWLCLDGVQSRYLLAAAADSSVAVHDVQYSGAASFQGSCVFKLDRRHPEGHKFSVASATWYPVDTGLFVSGSHDKTVKVWDTNALRVAVHFALPSKVTAVSMSSCAGRHCLIAVASASPEVSLCDPISGSLSHSLVGHSDAVWCAAWSASSEWHLVTGGADGQIRLWDIRSSGCVHAFDQHDTTMNRQLQLRARAQPRLLSKRTDIATAHEGAVTAVLPTPDCLHWISTGTDSRIRLWESNSFRNCLVNYPLSANRALKGRQIAVARDTRLLFHPSGSVVQIYDSLSGNLDTSLKGHMDAVNACCFSDDLQELYTGSNDCQICVWSPFETTVEDRDSWSP